MKASDFAELLLLGAIWGASFMLMKEAVPAFGVFALVEIRALGAALFLLPIVLLKRQGQDLLRFWPQLLVVGAINTAIPFCLYNYSLLYIDAALAAILNATAPMFGVVIAYLYLRESIGVLRIVGLCLGFAGVVLISIDQSMADTQTQVAAKYSIASLMPVFAALGATFFYGLSASYFKKHLSEAKPFAIAAGSQVAAALLLAPLAVFNLPHTAPNVSEWGSALFLAFVCTGLAYVLYFNLIAKIGASRSMTVGYLIPLFGILWGVLLLDETLSVKSLLGGSLILLGVMLATNVWVVIKRLNRSKPA